MTTSDAPVLYREAEERRGEEYRSEKADDTAEGAELLY